MVGLFYFLIAGIDPGFGSSSHRLSSFPGMKVVLT
jgi:hypothetical protein